MRRVLTCLALVATMLVAGANAWWCVGHMVIAEIARQNLNQGVEARVNKQFQFLNTWFPQTADMVSGACWADDLKSQSLEVMAGWHFINQVYNPDDVPVTTKNWPLQKINVASAITDLDHTARRNHDNDWIHAYATANLVHFFGDIHQPLHATDRFNKAFPDGDRGGNLIHVNWGGKAWPLHFIWDSVCAQYDTEPARPLNATSYAWIQSLANQYQANFSIPDAEKKVYNSTQMAVESFDAAVAYAYDNNTIVEGQNLTQQYMDTCKKVAGYRIAAAGYRLGSELNYLFGDDNKKPSAHAILGRIADAKGQFANKFMGRKH